MPAPGLAVQWPGRAPHRVQPPVRHQRGGRDGLDRGLDHGGAGSVVAGEVDSYRNLEPKSMVAETKKNIETPWTKSVKDGLGTRAEQVQKCYDMKPETPESDWTPQERDGASR